ncbi:hypothetical protein [Methylocystis heyeri]|uniref:Uncharacterized protein n=1 Tax=Methylocystis heyeri TaxID=391905 RepID=A0A6B8KBF2_9HYPH|nr:hypothetical protein [Methylocystis heyeri]QGM45486.1 hypothetical protein H2LOC_007135 [Methylocystis heyeri]
MKKLTKICFAPLGVRDAGAFPGAAKSSSMLRASRRTLVCVWKRDSMSGRLVCSWIEPAQADENPAWNSSEPPPSFALAA